MSATKFLLELLHSGVQAASADEAGTARPRPTPEEAAAFERLEELRLRALREGWGASSWRIC